jgi:hypothetical protein
MWLTRFIVTFFIFIQVVAVIPVSGETEKYEVLRWIISEAKSNRENTELARVASAMNPGEWAELHDIRPQRLMAVYTGRRENGHEEWHHIAGWTDDGHWDPRTGQFLYMGFRKQNKFIAYTERNNSWRIVPEPFGWNTGKPGVFVDPRKTQFGHVYGRNALDIIRGRYFFGFAGDTYIYSLADEEWSRVRGGGSMSMEYFPGIGLISHAVERNTSKSGYNLTVLDEKNEQWRVIAELPFSGYHAFARYNWVLDEMLFLGGSKSRAVYSMKRNGELIKLQDLPFDMTIRFGKLVVDPNSGNYLIFHKGELYEFSSKRNEYHKVGNYSDPWGRYEMPVPASISEHGVIMFVDEKTLLYKHSAE